MSAIQCFLWTLRLERGRHSYLRAVLIAAREAVKPVPF